MCPSVLEEERPAAEHRLHRQRGLHPHPGQRQLALLPAAQRGRGTSGDQRHQRRGHLLVHLYWILLDSVHDTGQQSEQQVQEPLRAADGADQPLPANGDEATQEGAAAAGK